MDEDKRVVSPAAIRRVLSGYFRQYKLHPGYTVISLLIPAIGSILIFFVPPLMVGKIINIFIAQGSITLESVIELIGIFGGSWFLGEVCWRIGLYTLTVLETWAFNDLGRESFQLLAERDYEFYASHFVGSLTKKGLAYARNFEVFTDTLTLNVATSLIPTIFAVIVMWGYSPWIPLALIGWIVVAVIGGLPLIRRRARLVALRHEAGSKMSGRLSDILTNMLAIKSFAAEKQELSSFGKFVNDFAQKFKKAADYHTFRLDMVLAPIYILANVTGLVLVIFMAQKLSLPAGTVVVVFAYYMQVSRFCWEINRIYRNIEASIGESAEFTQLILNPPIIADTPGAKRLRVTNAHIRFGNVDFRYHDTGRKRPAFFRHFNLDVSGCQRIGLVGPSGGGKTTITKLLLRFIDVESGVVTIDGQPINQVTQNSLREAIAYVPQESMLFHRTLSENIAYGVKRATEKEIIKAAKLAHAHEFIVSLPQGYKTMVGERGVKLSGGQRQRVAIARAILKNAPILILDEATSSLDSESEKYIQDGLKTLMKGKTVMVIAHRLSTIRHLDRIVVLDKGRVVQDGTHDQLIKQKGLYAKLWKHQSGGFVGEPASATRNVS
jgi:ATP-binding cassette, subfamily B, bacterial